MKKETAWIIVRSLITVAAVAVVLWLIAVLFQLTYPFWLAAFFTWMLKPLSSFLHHKARFPRGIAALCALLFGLSVVGGIITGLTFLIIDGIQRFADKVPNWTEQTFSNIQRFFNESVLPLWQQIRGAADNLSSGQGLPINGGISQIGSQLGTAVGQYAQRLADALTQIVLNVPTFLVAFLFILIAIYFFGKDWEKFTRGAAHYIPESVLSRLRAFYFSLRSRVFGYIRAQLILMLITGIIVFIGLSLLQVNGKVLLSVIVGIAEFLPYLGTGTILLPWSLYLLLTGSIGLSIGLAVLYGITMIVRQTIEPKVLSSSMNLNPIAVLVSMFAGLQLFGAVGLLLGPVLLVLIVILIDIGVFRDLKQFIVHGFRD
ncbi:sporulation integral membrane protein YtvI [Salibacterium halotolerans]|uniref:Sporulation integral membrane protein YtvI n=1 Tax=Salibacterium halotolerans TaxID=1884432 RepID=A0A1I5RK43_9BACI|nr:sporulation integral membrane protein YtvI [Salibacterium halotolerans]SFP58697.1 sporulation integral membrane protein YtvI [Salibacterium halotolerans]